MVIKKTKFLRKHIDTVSADVYNFHADTVSIPCRMMKNIKDEKNIGTTLALYPCPVIVVGAKVGNCGKMN